MTTRRQLELLKDARSVRIKIRIAAQAMAISRQPPSRSSHSSEVVCMGRVVLKSRNTSPSCGTTKCPTTRLTRMPGRQGTWVRDHFPNASAEIGTFPINFDQLHQNERQITGAAAGFDQPTHVWRQEVGFEAKIVSSDRQLPGERPIFVSLEPCAAAEVPRQLRAGPGPWACPTVWRAIVLGELASLVVGQRFEVFRLAHRSESPI